MLSEGRKAAMSEVLVEESRWGQLEPDHVHFDRRTMTEVGDGLCAAGIMKTTGPKPGDAPRPHRLIKMQGEVVTGADWNELVEATVVAQAANPDVNLTGLALAAAVAAQSSRPVSRRRLLMFWRKEQR
jgi:hypothetical protein